MTDQQPGYVPGAGLPLGLPSAPASSEPSAQVRGESAHSRGTNTPRTSSAEASRRVRAATLARIDAEMPDRDRAVLRVIGAHRYLTTRQVQQFVFVDHASDESAARTARVVTRRLSTLGLIRALERRVGGLRPGSEATIWHLAPAGARLLRADRINYRTYQPSPRFLHHCLAVADVHLAVRYMQGRSGITDVLVETEPDCWRRYAGPGGEQRWLQPDLFARLTTPDYVDHWFIEVDLGTESLPTLLDKCRQYEAYRAAGIEQERRGGFPLVLWVFTKPQRIDQLRVALHRSKSLSPALHRLTMPSGVQQTLEQAG